MTMLSTPHLILVVLTLANILMCSGQFTPLNDVGIFNGQLLGLGDFPDTHLDRISTGFGLDRLALRRGLGQGLGLGIGIGSSVGLGLRPGTVPIAGLGLSLPQCPQTCLLQSSWRLTARCRYTPIQLSEITGGYCLGCPVDLCDDGVQGMPIVGTGSRAGRRRGQRRRQRRQRRRMCRRFGICLGNRLGGAGVGFATDSVGTGAGFVTGMGYGGRPASGPVW